MPSTPPAGPPPQRRAPLRAALGAEAAADETGSRGRSVLLGLAVGLAVTVAGVALAFSIVAMPLFALASIDPGSGLDRDLVRTGLFAVALPFGGIVGVLSGIAVGVWYGRGGRLPRPDLRIHEQ